VQVRLVDSDILAGRMSEMREWLDRHDIEPDVFQYRMDADNVVFRVDFKVPSEAAAFAEAFAGTVVG
jgi:hypothetical protein